MGTNGLLNLQALLAGLQVMNAGLGAALPEGKYKLLIVLMFAALLASVQAVVQHVGNQTVPPPSPQSK